MYYLKFIRWWWLENLSWEARFAISSMVWVSTMFITIALSYIFLIDFSLYFMLLSLSAAIIYGLYEFGKYMKTKFHIWESRVFNKLKETK